MLKKPKPLYFQTCISKKYNDNYENRYYLAKKFDFL